MEPPLKSVDFKTLKRIQLQKYAKQYGIRANMKTDDIISALEQMVQSESSELSSIETCLDETPKEQTFKVATPLSQSGFNLFSVQPPWNDKDSTLDLTPDLDNEDKETPKNANTKSNQRERRTRSSSRNRTPKSAESKVRQPDGKTFSVERKTTKARVANLNKTKGKSNATKRASTSQKSVPPLSKKMRKDNDHTHNSEADESIDENLKNEILQEIRKKIAECGEQDPGKTEKEDTFSSRIPRFAASGVSIGTAKPITPGNKDWNKLHDRRFKKLESIDDYEKRKEMRAKRLLGSNQKNSEAVSRLAQPAKRGRSKIVKPVMRKGRPLPNLMSPTPAPKVTPKTPQSILKGVKKDNGNSIKRRSPRIANATGAVFNPTVISTKKMNLNFSSRSSKLATPKRVTILSDQNSTKQAYQKTPGTGVRNKSVLRTPNENRKSLMGTPKTLNTSVNNAFTPGGTKKTSFNLEESLKKPLSWVPHRGPLRPFNDTAKKPAFQDRIKNIKEPKVTDREKRKLKLVTQKKQAKDKRMMQRRGIK